MRSQVPDAMATMDRRPLALGSLAVLPDDILEGVLLRLDARDLSCLASVSSVLYILCREEPLWMHVCLEQHAESLLVYEESWRHTALLRLAKEKKLPAPESRPALYFSGFTSMFLYRRWYRCHVDLQSFAMDDGLLERTGGLTSELFASLYDGRMPVMLTDLIDGWNAEKKWTLENFSKEYADVALRVTVANGKPVKMRLADYASYVGQHHDEEPLYVFDEEFGEAASDLLQDYSVPPYFEEDLLSVLGPRRPPFRWIIMGPARSGASWHVDPSLTSAWNSLLVGRKRWALYPPGKVPPGVTLHMDEMDGETHADGPTSLQWWLEVYPLLSPEDRPIEVTQQAGETIFMPSGWWHCVLNLEFTIAVTHNFVNNQNFETVCLDMAPGFRHRGIARAGEIALHAADKLDKEREELVEERRAQSSEGSSADWEEWDGEAEELNDGVAELENQEKEDEEKVLNQQTNGESGRAADKEIREIGSTHIVDDDLLSKVYVVDTKTNGIEEGWRESLKKLKGSSLQNGLQGELSAIAEREYNLHGASNGEVASSELRHWLRCLWDQRPDMQPRVWKGACLALEAHIWLQRLEVICQKHSFQKPEGVERLPVGSGHNLVYLVGEYAIKMYVDGEEGEAAVKTLCLELELYRQINAAKSPVSAAIPQLVASGLLVRKKAREDEVEAFPWDGSGPEPTLEETDNGKVVSKEGERSKTGSEVGNGSRKGGRGRRMSRRTSRKQEQDEIVNERWPYIVTTRCEGMDLKSMYNQMSLEDLIELATFMGKTLAELHSLPLPSNSFMEKYIQESADSENGEEADDWREETLSPGDTEEENLSSQIETINMQNNSSTSCGLVNLSNIDQAKDNPVMEKKYPEVGDPFSSPNIVVPDHWKPFMGMVRYFRSEVVGLYKNFKWMPKHLVEQLDDYLIKDPVELVSNQGGENWLSPVWLHTDAMDDNIILKPKGNLASESFTSEENDVGREREMKIKENPSDVSTAASFFVDGKETFSNSKVSSMQNRGENHEIDGDVNFPKSNGKNWSGCLLDFGGTRIGDPVYDLVALHLSSFRCNGKLLQAFCKNYLSTLGESSSGVFFHGSHSTKNEELSRGDSGRIQKNNTAKDPIHRLSYRAMFYTIINEHASVRLIFKNREDLNRVKTLEQLEDEVWGVLNNVGDNCVLKKM